MAKSKLMKDSDLDAFKMAMLRMRRDSILNQCDPGKCQGWGASDREYSSAMKTYRQALRDFPSTVNVDDIEHIDVDTRKIPTYPDTYYENYTTEQEQERAAARASATTTQEAHVGINLDSITWPTPPKEFSDHIDILMDQDDLIVQEPPKPGQLDPAVLDEDGNVDHSKQPWQTHWGAEMTMKELREKYKDYDSEGVNSKGEIVVDKLT